MLPAMARTARPVTAVHAPTGAAAVTAYLAGFPPARRKQLAALRATLRAAMPAEATEKISYGLPTFALRRGVVAYGGFADHLSVFPMSARVVAQLESALAKYDTARGTIRLPWDRPLPLALLRRIVRLRLAELVSAMLLCRGA